MDYSQGIQFQTSLINMEEAQELTMKNQQKKATEAVTVWLHQALTDFLQGFPYDTCNCKGQKSAFEMALSKSKSKNAVEDAESEEESKCLAAEAAGEVGKNQMGGHQHDMWCKI